MLLRLRSSGFIEPCLPSPADRPPSGSNWIHEIKHDGYRLMARRDAAGVRLFTRNGNDWTPRYPLIVPIAAIREDRLPMSETPVAICVTLAGHAGLPLL
jgi:bifunctional non-homologous end joining protein LigD